MLRRLTLAAAPVSVALVAAATPAAADVRFLSYDPADRVTTALTRGLTLEVERGLFGGVSVTRLISTSARGAARISRGGPDQARRVLPEGASETAVYTLGDQGDGRALGRALCPGADAAFLVLGQVRAVRPLTMQAVGRWSDGAFRHCVTLRYDYRGEWVLPPGARPSPADDLTPVRP